MHVDKAAEIKAWHHQQHDKVFNFRKEMLDYCLQDVRILLAAIQVIVREDFGLMVLMEWQNVARLPQNDDVFSTRLFKR